MYLSVLKLVYAWHTNVIRLYFIEEKKNTTRYYIPSWIYVQGCKLWNNWKALHYGRKRLSFFQRKYLLKTLW